MLATGREHGGGAVTGTSCSMEPPVLPGITPSMMCEQSVSLPGITDSLMGPYGALLSQVNHAHMDFGQESFSFDPILPPSPLMPSSFEVTRKTLQMTEKMEVMLKRKSSIVDREMSDLDDDDDSCDVAGSCDESRKFARQNHSEIEKRRRDKMNHYITELSTMIPMCSAMSHKLDKLTVLRMAVQHMKTLRGSCDTHAEVSQKPAYLSDDGLNHLILKAADGFLFVVGCDRGKILYVSESVRNILHYSQSDLLGQSLFDFLNPKDISKVKEQLLSSDLAPRQKLIDAKTMLPVKTEIPQSQSQLCSGARRAFFCQMKRGYMSDMSTVVKVEKDELSCHKKKRSDQKNYCVIQCTGYVKSWPLAKMGLEKDNEMDPDSYNLSCLVAIGRLLPPFNPHCIKDTAPIKVRLMEFTSRHSTDGKFTYVDHRATSILGYLPQDLLGTSVYEYYHNEDIEHLSVAHRKVLLCKERVQFAPYRFKAKDNSFIHLQTKAYSFRNPWTKEIEYIVCTNTVLPAQEVTSSSHGMDPILDLYDPCSQERIDSYNVHSGQRPQSRLSVPGIAGGTRAGAGRIGRQIASEMQELHKHESNSHVESSSLDGAAGPRPAKRLKTGPGPSLASMSGSNVSHHSSTLPSSSQASSPDSSPQDALLNPSPNGGINLCDNSQDQDLMGLLEQNRLLDGDTSHGNDEAAMAVIMSLLEADAGLGGPVDFSDLPWPL